MTRGKILSVLFLIALLAGAGGWFRTTIFAWHHVRQLAAASEDDREARARAVGLCGEDAIAPLLRTLATADETLARNLEAGLRAAAADWPVDDPRTLRAAEAVAQAFPGLSQDGKKASLRFLAARADADDNHGSLPAPLARILGDLLPIAVADDDLRPTALGLAGALVENSAAGQWQPQCRELAIKGLADASPTMRLAALGLILRDPLRKDTDLLTRVAPFLRDPEPRVRRASIVALGTNSEVVREEHLLPLLHDDDDEVRRLCEVALRGRGLTDAHLHMARLISDPDPVSRMRVLPLLRGPADIDVDVWLRRLTLDVAPAVRAAAIRAASHDPSEDLRQRLGEMAQSDPSPTVREIARFYVERSQVRKVGN